MMFFAKNLLLVVAVGDLCGVESTQLGSNLRVGDQVVTHGLTRDTDANGKNGVIIEISRDKKSLAPFTVEVDDGSRKKYWTFSSKNLKRAEVDEEDYYRVVNPKTGEISV